MTRILLGTSGWEYPEWVGRVYPKVASRDRLAFYSRLFPIVEINTTFYHTPTVATVASWGRRTPDGFRFAAKFPQSITHVRRLRETRTELDEFLRALRPLRDSGKLVAALLQLPPSLPFNRGTVRAFYETLPSDLPVAVEFREPSWLAPESFDLLKEFRFAYVVVDEPLLPVRLEVTAPFVYLRWHGRGTRVWYDYTYSSEELLPWVERVQELARRASSVYGFFNNHFRGDAVVNGRILTELLGLPPVPWHRGLLDDTERLTPSAAAAPSAQLGVETGGRRLD